MRNRQLRSVQSAPFHFAYSTGPTGASREDRGAKLGFLSATSVPQDFFSGAAFFMWLPNWLIKSHL